MRLAFFQAWTCLGLLAHVGCTCLCPSSGHFLLEAGRGRWPLENHAYLLDSAYEAGLVPPCPKGGPGSRLRGFQALRPFKEAASASRPLGKIERHLQGIFQACLVLDVSRTWP